MNWQQVRLNWREVSKEFHMRWGRLTEADLKAIGGRRSKLVSRLQKLYAMDESRAELEAAAFLRTLY